MIGAVFKDRPTRSYKTACGQLFYFAMLLWWQNFLQEEKMDNIKNP